MILENNKDLYRVGIDIGGTFTDIVFISDSGSIITKKILSTPNNYSQAIIEGINDVLKDNGLSASSIKEVVHASTIVTNACIELKGDKIGFITTKGFRDILEITRGRMPVMYDITWQKPTPLAPRYLRFEVNERISANGEILCPLNVEEVKIVIDKLISHGVKSIGVCLLNSPKNPIHEQKIGQILKERAPGLYFSLSTEVMPMIKEYERSSETAVNAYVMPLVAAYLKSLRQNLSEAGVKSPLYIMGSSGGMLSPEIAAKTPIEIIEGGPAAGVTGCSYLAKKQNIDNLITFDMGGTTTKSAIIENYQHTLSSEYEVGGGIHRASRLLKGQGYVVRVPSIDIAEIGAGGGSILSIDKGGVLHVGPRSAGAVPGPVCYNRGGEEPTLTDADIVLGYLNPKYLVGGELKINRDKAFHAIEELVAKPMKIDTVKAAYGAYSIANANMMRAIRAVSSERGRDPRKFTLYAFGGAGAIHAVSVSRELGIKTIIVPPVPGVCSAFGLLCADVERRYTKSFSYLWNKKIWDKIALEKLNCLIEQIFAEATSSVESWSGRADAKPIIKRFIDIRFERQEWELTISLPDGKLGQAEMVKVAEDFKIEYQKVYGYILDNPMQVINLRLVATLPLERPSFTKFTRKEKPNKAKYETQMTRNAYWGEKYGYIDTPVLELAQIGQEAIKGPILVDCYDTTIVVEPDCTIKMGQWENIIINIEKAEV